MNFISSRTEKNWDGEDLTQTLRKIYRCRSKFLHGGVRFPNNNENGEGYFNEYTKSGKLKKRNGNIIINMIPSLRWMFEIVEDIYNKFIDELDLSKDSEDDIKKYDEYDNMDENKIWATVEGP